MIEMIDHFIKMGFDVNEAEEDLGNITPLKAAVLYKNFELVKALVERGAFIQNKNSDSNLDSNSASNLDVILYAEKLKHSRENNKKLTPEEEKTFDKIILFLKQKQ